MPSAARRKEATQPQLLPESCARWWVTIPVLRKRKWMQTMYAVTRLTECANPTWRFRKSGGKSYDVSLTEFGWSCGCWDWLSRKEDHGTDCKHIAAVRGIATVRQTRGTERPQAE